MTLLRWIVVVVVGLAIVAALVLPVGPAPGFFIGGSATAAPATWMDTSKTDEVSLKVPGTPPRVVIIWVVDHEGELYVVGSPDSGWVKMIGAGSPVDLRIGDETYALAARRFEGDPLPVLKAYVAKYEPGYPEIIAGFPEPTAAGDNFAVFHLARG
ncbi:MAG: hypothetical protein AAF515_17630 [Pseudomonadota bacterium]